MSNAANKITVLQPLNTNGFFECLMPKILGGEEYSLAEYSHLIQSVSQKDGSTGWRLMILPFKTKKVNYEGFVKEVYK